MSWVATAVTLGSVAYGAYNSSQGPDNPTAVFGKKPQVAPFVPVNLQDQTATAVAGDQANFDSITKYLDSIVPGFEGILQSGLSNASQEVSGQIPADVQSEILRDTAQQSIQGGFGGTPLAHSLTARDLGLTSLNLTQTGQNSFQQWANTAEQAYSPFTVSTPFQAATTTANNAGQQATQQYAYDVAAAPNPAALGEFNYQTAQQQQQLSTLALLAGRGGWGGAGFGGFGGTGSTPVYQGTPVFNYNPSSGGYGGTGA